MKTNVPLTANCQLVHPILDLKSVSIGGVCVCEIAYFGKETQWEWEKFNILQ